MSERGGETVSQRALPVSREAAEHANRHILTPTGYAHYEARLEISRPTLLHSLRYLHLLRISQLEDTVIDPYMPSALVFYGAAERQAKLTGQRLPEIITTDIGALISHQFIQAGQSDYIAQFRAGLPAPTQPYPNFEDHLTKDNAHLLFDGALDYINDMDTKKPLEFSERFTDASLQVLRHAMQRFVEAETGFLQAFGADPADYTPTSDIDARLVGAIDTASLLEVAYMRTESINKPPD